MTITTMSSRDFNQDTSGAKRAAKEGPVFITDRGVPAHVLLTIEDYRKLSGDEHCRFAVYAGRGRDRVRPAADGRAISPRAGPFLMFVFS